MNDDTTQQAVPTDPAASADDSAASDQPQKNPLDVLEELLKDSGSAGADPKAVAKQTEEDKARQMEELQQKIAQQAAIDEQKIAEQQKLLESLKETPQYQARVQQEEQKVQDKSQEDSAGKGFEITQLDHDKV